MVIGLFPQLLLGYGTNCPPEGGGGVTSVDQFRTQLKAYLFKLAYDV